MVRRNGFSRRHGVSLNCLKRRAKGTARVLRQFGDP